MTLLFRSSAHRLALVVSIGTTAITLLAAGSVEAQHRARLARGLESKVVVGSTESVRVLLQAPQAEIDRLAETYGIRVLKRLEIGAVVEGTGHEMANVAGDSLVGAVAADDVVTSTMAVTTQATGANLLWSNGDGRRHFNGLTGAGIGVAVIDSGIGAHPDVASRVRLSLDFTEGDESVADGYGHGTHIAGIIAGSGAGSRSASGTAYVGMAPAAELISLRVLGSDGTGYVSDVIEAIEWAIANQHRHKIRVLNLSLGHFPSSEYADDPMAQAVERAVASGLVVVASAGNLGKTADGTPVIGAVVSPGFTPGALTVGALNTKATVVRSDDGVATYSSRGPVGDPDDPSTWEIKPDLVAPGNAITSAGLAGSYLFENFPERQVTGENGGNYLVLSGSSMATAVVSGAVAQLLQAQPRLTPAEVKFALQFTAERLDGFGLIEQGAGSLNVPLAAALVVTRYVFSAPTTVVIAGETVEGSQIAFANTVVWGSRGGVSGNTVVWGSRGGVSGNTVVWGSRGGVSGDTVVWGSRGGVFADTVVWGSRGGVSGDTVVWGSRGGISDGAVLWGNTVVWGSRGGVNGDTVVWGSRGSAVSADTVVWGSRNGTVQGDTVVWGSRGTLGGNTVVWGSRGGVSADTVVWGSRGR